MHPSGLASATAIFTPTPSGIALAPAPNTAADPMATVEEVRTLLRRRLILIAVTSCVLLTLPFVIAVSGSLLGDRGPGRLMQFAVGVSMVLSAAVAQWLIRKPGLSERALRFAEFVQLAGGAALLASLRVEMIGDGLALSDEYFLHWVGAMNGFGWLVGIVGFWVIVPNTWRAAAVRVFALAVCPFLIDLSWVASDPALLPRLFPVTLFTSPMVAFGLIVALLGSAKVTKLQARVKAAEKAAAAAKALGPYELKRKIGQGGMGEVWLAEHRLLKRPCAVKLIRQDGTPNPSAVARFEREVKTTAQLRHPNTVEVYDFGRADDGTFFYVMEHLNGLPLDDVVSRFGPMPAGRVVHLLKQVCGALAEAHAAGLVHRDIKPGNIMLCRLPGAADVAKLLDFGLARQANGADPGLTTAGMIVGTPHYIAPEQTAGDVDHRADLYALGATAFHLLTGRPPFDRPSAVDVVIAHRTDAVPTFAEMGVEVPAELEAVIRKCLIKDPAQRYETADRLRSALGRCRDVRPWTDADADAWWEVNCPAG